MIAVASGAVLRATALIYVTPILGLLLLAAAAQIVVGALAPAVADRAAGVGGIVGAALGVLAARRLARRPGAAQPAVRVERVTS